MWHSSVELLGPQKKLVEISVTLGRKYVSKRKDQGLAVFELWGVNGTTVAFHVDRKSSE